MEAQPCRTDGSISPRLFTLKGRQAMIAVGYKLIRVFFAIMTKGVVYNGSKMIEDIHRPTQLPQAA